MKITFVLANADLSGGVRVVCDHAMHLYERGHDVTIVTAQPAGRPFRHRVRSWLGGHGWPRSSWRRPSHLDALPLNVRRLAPGKTPGSADVPDADVIIGTWWATMEWIMALPAEKGVRIHFVQGHEVFESQPIERVEAVYRLPVAKIAVSPWLVDILAQRYDQHDVALAFNGIDTTRFSAPPRERNEPPTVGFIYSHSPMKRVDMLIEACRIAAGRIDGLRVRCFGSREPSRALPLPPQATMVHNPAQALIPSLYAQADAWLIGSNSEGFGLPVLEAMACRTPVISTPAGAAPQLLADGAGLIVPHDNAGAMAEAIESICTAAPDRWRAMSEAGRRTAQRYTHALAAQRFEQELRNIVQRQRAAQMQ